MVVFPIYKYRVLIALEKSIIAHIAIWELCAGSVIEMDTQSDRSLRYDEIGERLLDAAAAVFAEQGYEGVRVADVAERAGVSTGAIYNRFAGKSEMLMSALKHRRRATLMSVGDTQNHGLLESLGSELVDEGDFSTLVFEAFAASRRDSRIAEILQDDIEQDLKNLTAWFEQAKDRSQVASGFSSESAALFCESLAVGIRTLAAVGVEMPQKQEWSNLISFLLQKIAGTDAEEIATVPATTAGLR